MGWETRRGRRYYYRSRRINGRVVKEYVGTGPAAEAAARQDADAAEEHARNRAALVDLMTDVAAVLALDDHMEARCAEIWIAAGYHKYRGAWRKKRKPRAAEPNPGSGD